MQPGGASLPRATNQTRKPKNQHTEMYFGKFGTSWDIASQILRMRTSASCLNWSRRPTEVCGRNCSQQSLPRSLNFVVVCVYDVDAIYLHGVRDMTSLKELEPNLFGTKYEWRMPEVSHYNSLEAVIEASKAVNAVKCEGFVVVDGNFNRVKVKSPTYVQIALLRSKDADGNNAKRMLSILQLGEADEFLAYFPQWQDSFKEVQSVYDGLVDTLSAVFDELKELEQAEFARAVGRCAVWQRGLLFQLRKKTTTSARQCLAGYKDIFLLYSDAVKTSAKADAKGES